MRMAPRIKQDDFRCFYSTGTGWGSCRQWRDEQGRLQQAFEPYFTLDERTDA